MTFRYCKNNTLLFDLGENGNYVFDCTAAVWLRRRRGPAVTKNTVVGGAEDAVVQTPCRAESMKGGDPRRPRDGEMDMSSTKTSALELPLLLLSQQQPKTRLQSWLPELCRGYVG